MHLLTEEFRFFCDLYADVGKSLYATTNQSQNLATTVHQIEDLNELDQNANYLVAAPLEKQDRQHRRNIELLYQRCVLVQSFDSLLFYAAWLDDRQLIPKVAN